MQHGVRLGRNSRTVEVLFKNRLACKRQACVAPNMC